MKKIIVGAAQIGITEKPEENVEKILKYLEEASKKQASITVFPETSIYPNLDGIKRSSLLDILKSLGHY